MEGIGLTQLMVKERRTRVGGVFIPEGLWRRCQLGSLSVRPSCLLAPAFQPLALFPNHETYDASLSFTRLVLP